MWNQQEITPQCILPCYTTTFTGDVGGVYPKGPYNVTQPKSLNWLGSGFFPCIPDKSGNFCLGLPTEAGSPTKLIPTGSITTISLQKFNIYIPQFKGLIQFNTNYFPNKYLNDVWQNNGTTALGYLTKTSGRVINDVTLHFSEVYFNFEISGKITDTLSSARKGTIKNTIKPFISDPIKLPKNVGDVSISKKIVKVSCSGCKLDYNIDPDPCSANNKYYQGGVCTTGNTLIYIFITKTFDEVGENAYSISILPSWPVRNPKIPINPTLPPYPSYNPCK